MQEFGDKLADVSSFDLDQLVARGRTRGEPRIGAMVMRTLRRCAAPSSA